MFDSSKLRMHPAHRAVPQPEYTVEALTELRANFRSSFIDAFRHFLLRPLRKAMRGTLSVGKAVDEISAEVAKFVDMRFGWMDRYVDEYMTKNGVLMQGHDEPSYLRLGDLKMLLDHLMQVMPDGSRIATERMTGDDWRTLRDWLAELKETDHERWEEYHEECERADVELIEEIRDMEFRKWRDCPLFFQWTDDIVWPPDRLGKSDESDESDEGE